MIYRRIDAHDNAIIVVYLLYNKDRQIVLRTIISHRSFLAPLRSSSQSRSRAHVSFGQRQHTELWNNQFPEVQDFRSSGFTEK